MRFVGVVVALVACNQAYGLDSTKLDIDATSPGCPPFGKDPVYSTFVTQALFVDCFEYQLDPDRKRAVGLCEQPTRGKQPVEGMPDGPVAPAIGLPVFVSDATRTLQYQTYRMLDERRVIFLEFEIRGATVTQRPLIYRRADDGSWLFEEQPPFATVLGQTISTAAHGPDGERLFVGDGLSAAEWVHRATRWEIVNTLRPSDIGAMSFLNLAPSRDGLRLMFSENNGVMYTDRASLDVPFRKAGPVPGTPLVTAVTMTGDCERIYFTGLQSVFFAERL